MLTKNGKMKIMYSLVLNIVKIQIRLANQEKAFKTG